MPQMFNVVLGENAFIPRGISADYTVMLRRAYQQKIRRAVIKYKLRFVSPGAGQTAPIYPNSSGCEIPIKSDSLPPIEKPVIAVFSLPFAAEKFSSINGIRSVIISFMKLS